MHSNPPREIANKNKTMKDTACDCDAPFSKPIVPIPVVEEAVTAVVACVLPALEVCSRVVPLLLATTTVVPIVFAYEVVAAVVIAVVVFAREVRFHVISMG